MTLKMENLGRITHRWENNIRIDNEGIEIMWEIGWIRLKMEIIKKLL